MSLAFERTLHRLPVGGFLRYARSFYQLLGNRRKAERQATSGNIFATVPGIVADRTYACMCVDISPKGIGIECLEPMSVDAAVELHSDDDGPHRLASVRYCREFGLVYRIGLEFISNEEMIDRRASVARLQAGQRTPGKTA